jgi:hypothetical protein
MQRGNIMLRRAEKLFYPKIEDTLAQTGKQSDPMPGFLIERHRTKRRPAISALRAPSETSTKKPPAPVGSEAVWRFITTLASHETTNSCQTLRFDYRRP